MIFRRFFLWLCSCKADVVHGWVVGKEWNTLSIIYCFDPNPPLGTLHDRMYKRSLILSSSPLRPYYPSSSRLPCRSTQVRGGAL